VNIPKQFTLLGHTITVEFDPALYCKEEEYGECHFDTLSIKLQSQTEGYPLQRCLVEQSYLHEVTHMILYHMGEKELNDNEKFVDLFAGLLHQVLTTAKEG